jgi:hypothetical protein
MKRWMILIALCLFPSLVPSPAHAVQLEQGWFVKWGWTALYGHDNLTNSQFGVSWYPTSPTGDSGPINIQSWGYLSHGRIVTVSQSVDVPPGTLFEDFGRYYHVPNNAYDQLYFEWETNYDAAKMQLQVIRKHLDGASELFWTQSLSGHQLGYINIEHIYPVILDGEKIEFQLVVVPEPPTWLVLGLFTACLLLSRTCARNLLSDKGSLP